MGSFPAPMIAKSSPSVRSFSVSGLVKSGRLSFMSAASSPFPSPLSPWQRAHWVTVDLLAAVYGNLGELYGVLSRFVLGRNRRRVRRRWRCGCGGFGRRRRSSFFSWAHKQPVAKTRTRNNVFEGMASLGWISVLRRNQSRAEKVAVLLNHPTAKRAISLPTLTE